MTTIKKFKEVINLSIKMLEPPKNVLESEGYDSAAEGIGYAISYLQNLQPPRPTCSTCKYYSASDSSCDNWDVVGDPSHDGFGCIEHSDYGDAK